jgi:hypothetical protein
MKPTTNTQTLESNGIKSSVSFGIKEDGFAHIFNVLRNQLYSDKVLAVVREYSCNASDAHVAAGKADVPIKVTLPNRLNPNLSIRDYGDALSDDDIKNIYAFYGESTKRNTNDQIGMLGIGSKAAFAYGDNFVINSYINGEKNTYNAFIDPSQVGQISKLESTDTDEPNGIEIVVPVKLDDIHEFEAKAKSLFEYFPVKPIIAGTSDFIYENNELLFEGDGWQWNKGENRYADRDATAIMGNIAYPIEAYALNLKDDDSRLNSLIRANLIMKFDIGDLEISASREKLQFTDKTKQAVIDRLKIVEEQVIEKALDQFGKCDSMFAAKSLYGTLMDWTSGLHEFRDILSKKLTWNGQVISGNSYSFDYDKLNDHEKSVGKLVIYKKPNRGFKWRSEKTEQISCDKDVVIVKNDLGSTRGMMGRILPLVEDQKKKVYMFTFKNEAAGKALLEEENFDAKMILASSLEKKSLSDYYTTSTSSTGNTSAHSSKHKTSVFEVAWETITAEAKESSWFRNKTNSAYFNVCEADLSNDSGVYVIIDKFQIETPTGFMNPVDMNQFQKALKKQNIEVPASIIAVKVKGRSKVEENPNMINFFDWASTKLQEVIDKDDLVQALIDHETAEQVFGRDWVRGSVFEVADKVVDSKSPFLKFTNALDKMRCASKDRDFRVLKGVMEQILGAPEAHKIITQAKPSHNLASLKAKVEKRYSMLTFVDNWKMREMNSEGVKDFANYVNTVDVASI